MSDPMPRLKVKLIHGWRPLDNPTALATYTRDGSKHPGQLQFSIAHHKAGPVSGTSESTLLDLCKKIAGKVQGGQILATRSGNCHFGIFGTVVVKGKSPAQLQVWVLSNQRDFILITHTCPADPDPIEVQEAEQIALLTGCE